MKPCENDRGKTEKTCVWKVFVNALTTVGPNLCPMFISTYVPSYTKLLVLWEWSPGFMPKHKTGYTAGNVEWVGGGL